VGGLLVPGADMGASMYVHQTMPDECQISWWYMIGPADYEPGDRCENTVIDLSRIPKDQSGTLTLTFTEDQNWTAQLRSPDGP
jgi:hypothetical protein